MRKGSFCILDGTPLSFSIYCYLQFNNIKSIPISFDFLPNHNISAIYKSIPNNVMINSSYISGKPKQLQWYYAILDLITKFNQFDKYMIYTYQSIKLNLDNIKIISPIKNPKKFIDNIILRQPMCKDIILSGVMCDKDPYCGSCNSCLQQAILFTGYKKVELIPKFLKQINFKDEPKWVRKNYKRYLKYVLEVD